MTSQCQKRFLSQFVLILLAGILAGITLCSCFSFLINAKNGAVEFWTRRLTEEGAAASHKSLLPLSQQDYVGFSLSVLGLVMAAGGGIGGGGILVPIYILILRIPAKHAIPLSNVTVFGGAIANTLLNASKRHPLADRPLIDWDMILIMEPLTIAGALVGANFNKLLPERVIVIMLVLLLSMTAYKTLQKALSLYRNETWDRVETEEWDEQQPDIELVDCETGSSPKSIIRSASNDNLNQSSSDELSPVGLKRSHSLPSEDFVENWVDEVEICDNSTGQTPSSSELFCSLSDELVPESERLNNMPTALKRLGEESESESEWNSNMKRKTFLIKYLRRETSLKKAVSGLSKVENRTHELSSAAARVEKIILEQERHTPMRNVCTVTALFMVVLNINIIKGGGALESPIGIKCASMGFWIAQVLILLCIFSVTVTSRSYLLNRGEIKDRIHYKYVEGDIRWNRRATIIYPAICWVAGFFAGLFGIGGGIVKGPLMLQMGVIPSVASATSACMILFTSFTATTSFAVFGMLITDYAAICAILGFFATLVGQTVMSYLLRRYQRNSYIAFCIGFVVLLSAICMTMESVISFRGGELPKSSNFCSSEI